MLDNLFEMLDEVYGKATLFMGLAFKFETGIAIIDKHSGQGVTDGFIIDWVSFGDIEQYVSVICKDMDELKEVIREFAL
ncbi:hypothetical protein [Paenibacillus massiliensis]|uniref:hypothetical protein n=1 Tax=Paenibacillus massiliensis TaxID=225917 RepID=UPI000374B724|nr:hypothetical protein [Paenibacillus massiliensis]